MRIGHGRAWRAPSECSTRGTRLRGAPPGQSTVGPGMGYYVRLACAVLADHRLNFWMGPQRYERWCLLDKGRARRIASKEAIEMHRGHARIADGHVEIRRIDFPQCDGAFCHGGRQAALGIGMASPQVDRRLNPAVVSRGLGTTGPPRGAAPRLRRGGYSNISPAAQPRIAPMSVFRRVRNRSWSKRSSYGSSVRSSKNRCVSPASEALSRQRIELQRLLQEALRQLRIQAACTGPVRRHWCKARMDFVRLGQTRVQVDRALRHLRRRLILKQAAIRQRQRHLRFI